MLGHNRWLKFGGPALRVLLTTLCALYIVFLIVMVITLIIFGEVPVSYNGEPPWNSGLSP